MQQLRLIATTAFGLESVVARELTALGYDPQIVQTGRVAFAGDRADVCRANLWLRAADRLLIEVGRFAAPDFEQLFDQTRGLPWETWIGAEAAFPVRGRSVKSTLTSVPACQRTVKKAIVERLADAHRTAELPESGPPVGVEVSLLEDEAVLTIDTSGAGLHKRGYRTGHGAAQIKETLAAALVLLSFWRPDRALIDPFCGTGTIPIEAALIGRNIAPGLGRTFAAEAWPALPGPLWHTARKAAEAAARKGVDLHILGTDRDGSALAEARRHAVQAGVADSVHFQRQEFAQLASKHRYGLVITNPPYGERLGDADEVAALYARMPSVLRRLATWSHFILTAHPGFEKLVGRPADRRRKLYNGQIACTYFQFHGPRPEDEQPGDAPPADPGAPAGPVFGAVAAKTRAAAERFAARLEKQARHLRRWPARGITCYRLYDRDVPEVPLVVDRYEDRLHVADVSQPESRTAAEHADWVELMLETAGRVLDIPRPNVFVKRRARQRGARQYTRQAELGKTIVACEGGLKFRVNLSDYIDTGLFLDHRITRGLVGDLAEGKRLLNLFAYTGAFTVYAAAGGAASTTSVDLSPKYLEWAAENLRLNNLQGPAHELVRSDVLEFLHDQPRPDPQQGTYDLAVVDVPTYSNSKRTREDWDVQRDHVDLLNRVISLLSPGGVLFFATNFRRFKLDAPAIHGATIRDITRQTIPDDFRNKRVHRCWRMHKEG